MNRSLEILKDNSKYIITAGLLLFFGAILGAVFSKQLFSMIEAQLEVIQKLGESFADNSNPLYPSWVIFWNNFRAALMFIILGGIFAILPIFGLIINGILIGVVLTMVGGTFSTSLLMLLVGVMPHGILEIPAILIAGGMGIKLGTVWFKPIPSYTRWESFKYTWRETYGILGLIFILLVVAALIEGLVTPLLINFFMGEILIK